MKITLELTENQARTVALACEALARLGIGQIGHVLHHLPLREDRDWSLWHRDAAIIRQILLHHNIFRVDGYNSSLGITMEQVSEEAKAAWDIYKAITDPEEVLAVSREGKPKVAREG